MDDIFEELPPELNEHIRSYFEQKYRLTARSVCKRWLRLFESESIDIYLPLLSQIDSIIEVLNNRSADRVSMTVHKADLFRFSDYNRLLTSITNLTGIEIKAHYKQRFASTGIQSAKLKKLEKIILPYNLLLIDTVLPNLTHLDVYDVRVKPSKTVYLPNLEHLNCRMTKDLMASFNPDKLTALIVKDIDDSHYRYDISFNRFSQLRILNIEHIPPFFSEPDGPFTATYDRNVIVINLPNLEELNVSPKFLMTSPRVTKLTVHREITADLFKYTQLKSLTVKGLRMNPAVSHFTSFQQLEEFKIEGLIQPSRNLLQHLNSKNLTKLSSFIMTGPLNNVFDNLRELNLDCTKVVNYEILSNLFKLEKLSIKSEQMLEAHWLKSLTTLTSLELIFAWSMTAHLPLDLSHLTALRTLFISVNTNQRVSSVSRLTNLERLDLPNTPDDIFDTLTKLTRLSRHEISRSQNLSKLTNLRELDYFFMNDDDIMALTSLHHLTYLICRTASCTGVHLTCLTRLQSLGFSREPTPTGLPVKLWSKYTVWPQVAAKLPYLIYTPDK